MKKLDRQDYDRRFPTGPSEQIMIAADRFVKEVREAAAYGVGSFSAVDFAINEVLMGLRNERFEPQAIAESAEFSAKTIREVSGKSAK